MDDEFGHTQCWWEGSRCSPQKARWAAAHLFLCPLGCLQWRADGCSEDDRWVMSAGRVALHPPAQWKIYTHTCSISFEEACMGNMMRETERKRERGWAYAPGSLWSLSECSLPSCNIPLSTFLKALHGFLLPMNTSTSRAPLFSCTDRKGCRHTDRWDEA